MNSKLSKRKKILFVLGTRPEALKLAPIILECRRSVHFDALVCHTGQHDELARNAFSLFGIQPDFNLAIMQPNQTLESVTIRILARLRAVYEKVKPDWTAVQGDTTSAFAGALAAYYCRIPVAHIEAGLRSHDAFNPFPEEKNRTLISHLAEVHFAPTPEAQLNLLTEGIPRKSIFVTGNTIVDAMEIIRERLPKPEDSRRKIILITAHRRENFGAPLRSICAALRDLAKAFPEARFVLPVHPNPNVRDIASRELSGLPNVQLMAAMSYLDFLRLLNSCHFVLTDSGGVQEEAPSFNKPVLVMRSVSERMEGVRLGCAKLVGTSREVIFKEAAKLLRNPKAYEKMQTGMNPYGDGEASKRILSVLKKYLPGKPPADKKKKLALS